MTVIYIDRFFSVLLSIMVYPRILSVVLCAVPQNLVYPVCIQWFTSSNPQGLPCGSVVKSLPAVQETQVWSLGWKDPLEKGMATHLGILAWRTPWAEELGGLQSMGSERVRCNWVTDIHPKLPVRASPLFSLGNHEFLLWICFCFLDKFFCYILFNFYFIICLFVWLCWVFIEAHRLPIASQGLSLVEVHGLLTAVPPAAQSPGCRSEGFSSCSMRA